jgi:hypothetical protein
VSDQRYELALAVAAVTDRAPMITRGVVNACKSSKPIGWRKNEFNIAISQTRALLDDLMTRQVTLGWRDRDDAGNGNVEPIGLLHQAQRKFLQRFMARGWLSAERQDPFEKLAVDYAVRKGWLRLEGSEAHFTPLGRSALLQDTVA